MNLALPGAAPNEQAFLVRVFARHHREQTRFLVWSIDEVWCSADAGNRTEASPLPYWLYQSSDGEYLSHMLSPDSLDLSLRRGRMLLGLAGQAGPDDGFDPYPADVWARRQPANVPRLAALQQPTEGEPVDAPMPALPVLAQVLSELDLRIRVIIVTPPIFARFLPLPGSMAEQRDAACHKRIAQIAAARVGTVVLNLRVDSALTRDQTNFLDETHYNDLVAQFVEGEIVNATGGGPR